MSFNKSPKIFKTLAMKEIDANKKIHSSFAFSKNAGFIFTCFYAFAPKWGIEEVKRRVLIGCLNHISFSSTLSFPWITEPLTSSLRLSPPTYRGGPFQPLVPMILFFLPQNVEWPVDKLWAWAQQLLFITTDWSKDLKAPKWSCFLDNPKYLLWK